MRKEGDVFIWCIIPPFPCSSYSVTDETVWKVELAVLVKGLHVSEQYVFRLLNEGDESRIETICIFIFL